MIKRSTKKKWWKRWKRRKRTSLTNLLQCYKYRDELLTALSLIPANDRYADKFNQVGFNKFY